MGVPRRTGLTTDKQRLRSSLSPPINQPPRVYAYVRVYAHMNE